MPADRRFRLASTLFLALLIGVTAPGCASAKSTRRAADAAGAPARPAAAQAAASTSPQGVADRPAVQQFVRDMVERHRFDEQALLALFTEVRTSADVLRLIAPARPTFKRSWTVYRGRFLDALRIREGTRFWREHQSTVARAAQKYGVPPEIIVSIIGVETIYGRIMGDFRVIDALTTLAFEDPRRADYFREELTDFLLYTRDSKLDPLGLRGSFAGAIGIPQFMPGSIRRFAVDFDGDAVIDLRASPADAIGSVARFLAEHGWRSGEPTHFRASFEDTEKIAPLITAGIEPRFKPSQLVEYGVTSPDDIPADMPLALIDLPNGDAPTVYALGAPNFYVITRYNRSSFYAMAVIELAGALKAARP
ncbi:MAG TPA: lytic murein transglycosylase B [Burkholderiaceae bacterium]|nr:lytic murein transglycosylase B [Burkholderiaceae bacterium]